MPVLQLGVQLPMPLAQDLRAAVEQGDRGEFLRLVRSAGGGQAASDLVQTPDPDTMWTLLHTACLKGHAGLVRVMLQVVAAPDRLRFLLMRCEHHTSEQTALHISAMQENQDCVKALFECNIGVDETWTLLDSTNAERRTALHEGVLQNSCVVVDFLLTQAARHPGGLEAAFTARAQQRPPLSRTRTATAPRFPNARRGPGEEGTVVPWAVKHGEIGALEFLARHLAVAMEGSPADGWSREQAKEALKLAARQPATQAMEVLVKHLPRTAEIWREPLHQALRRDAGGMVTAMSEVLREPGLVTFEHIRHACAGQCISAMLAALSENVELFVERKNQDDLPWEHQTHRALTPTVFSVSCHRDEEANTQQFKLSEDQERALKRPWYAPLSRPALCEVHLLPAHLLSDEDTLFRVVNELALNAPVEAFGSPFAQGVVVEAWKGVSGFYFVDLVLNVVNTVVVTLLALKSRPSYPTALLGVGGILVFKDVLDEFLQFSLLGVEFVKQWENWFDAGRVLLGAVALGSLWLQQPNVTILAAWAAWTWIHTLADMRGVSGFGHRAIAMIRAIFNPNVATLGCMLVAFLGGATAAFLAFEEKGLFQAQEQVFTLAVLGHVEPWKAQSFGWKFLLVVLLSLICVAFMPLFISVVSTDYSEEAKRAAESFHRQRAILAMEYNVATLPKLLRCLRNLRCLPKLLCCLTCPGSLQQAPSGGDQVQVLISIRQRRGHHEHEASCG